MTELCPEGKCGICDVERLKNKVVRLQPVADAAFAYMDQLCTFNVLDHPEVQRRRLELRDAIGAYHNPPARSQEA